MKYLLWTLLFLVPVSAQAQTMVDKQTANTYFANCVKQPPTEQFSQESQNMMCACTAARMTQFFTMEDMQAMMSTDPAVARPAYNKMLMHIYAPCMETPAREHYTNTCLANPDSAKFGNPNKICTCLGNNLGEYLRMQGPNLFRTILSYNPNVTDPMQALYDDPGFQATVQNRLASCIK